MNVLDSKSLSSESLATIKTVSLSRLFNQLVSLFKRTPVATKPVDMEIDNLDWYRTFPIKK